MSVYHYYDDIGRILEMLWLIHLTLYMDGTVYIWVYVITLVVRVYSGAVVLVVGLEEAMCIPCKESRNRSQELSHDLIY